MMMPFSNASVFIRVRTKMPCPICGKSDWCSVTTDRQFAICMRVAQGAIQATKNGGWLHRITQRPFGFQTAFKIAKVLKPSKNISGKLLDKPIDWASKTVAYQKAMTPRKIAWLARDLGISLEIIWRLNVGWVEKFRAYSFPMRDGQRYVRGIRLRNRAGKKWAIKDSLHGLFVPSDFPWGEHGLRLVIAEGPTDAGALLDLGFFAIGRPSCTGGIREIKKIISGFAPSQVVVFADGDEAGKRGADTLAKAILGQIDNVCVVTPPNQYKDIRAWKFAGATQQDVIRLIESEPDKVIMKSRAGLFSKVQMENQNVLH